MRTICDSSNFAAVNQLKHAMKKTLLFVSLLTAVSMYARDDAAPASVWANILTGIPGQDQSSSISVYGNNAVYWMLTDGSTSADRDIMYGGEELYQGASYNGTSSNKNLTLLKTDAGGVKQWCVYSSWGDFSQNEGGIAVTPEGGAVFSCTVRHTDGYLDKPITIVDAKGYSTEIEWKVEKRWKRLIVGYVSPEGELQWVRTYDLDNSPVPDATGSYASFTSDAITNTGVAVDADGNIYVCGNYRTALTIPKPDGTSVTLRPKNVTGWTGSPQSSVGVLYLVKLDRDGYYLNHIDEEGDEITASAIQNIEWHDGSLYVSGYLKGEGNVSVSGVSLKPTKYICPVIGRFNSNLGAAWLTCLPGDAVMNASVIQNTGLTVSEGNVWYTGMYNGKISDPSDQNRFVASAKNNPREGFVIKLDSTDGSWLAGASSKDGFGDVTITGYFKAIVPVAEPGKVYIYGYNMTAGVFLRCYDRATLVADPEASWNIVTSKGMVTCQNIAYVPEISAAYVTVRSNQAFQPLGGELSENPGGFTNLLARFNLPEDFKSGIRRVESEDTALSISYSRGNIRIFNRSGNAETVYVLDLAGRKVFTVKVRAGEERGIDLEPGIYIVNGRKIML